MEIENLTIKEIREIQSMFSGIETQKDIISHYIGKYVIVRTYSDGVFFGKLKKRAGMEVLLEECRVIYRWEGAFTLSEIAIDGVKTAKLSKELKERFTQCIAIIPCEEKCINQLKNMDSYE